MVGKKGSAVATKQQFTYLCDNEKGAATFGQSLLVHTAAIKVARLWEVKKRMLGKKKGQQSKNKTTINIPVQR